MTSDMIYIDGKRAKKGERMVKGTKWRLAKITGKKPASFFVGTLRETINVGNVRLAIFTVPK
jgi:hypothetical protein